MSVRSTSGRFGVDGLSLRTVGASRRARFYKMLVNQDRHVVFVPEDALWATSAFPEAPASVNRFDFRQNLTAHVRVMGSISDDNVRTSGRAYDEYFILATKLFDRPVREERRGREVSFRLSLASNPTVADVARVLVGR